MKSIIKLGALAAVFGASVASQAQLIDQITGQTLGPTGYASQEFEPANASFFINAIDDFTISQATNVTGIDVGGLLYNLSAGASWSSITGYRIEFYSSPGAGAANLTGDQGSRTALTFNNPGGTSPAIINISFASLTLNPGTYYVGVMAQMPFTNGGQFGVEESTGGTPGGGNGWQVNPGGGFGAGTSFQPTTGSKNMAYRLIGQPVPEPGTFLAIGLGVAGLLAARRRNRK